MRDTHESTVAVPGGHTFVPRREVLVTGAQMCAAAALLLAAEVFSGAPVVYSAVWPV